MAFTEAQLTAALDPATTARTIGVTKFIPNNTNTDVYVVGVTAPYAGRSRWITLANTLSAAQAATAIQTGLQ